MNLDLTLLFVLFATILGLLFWGRFRHDFVAATGMLVAVVLGLVPENEAFSGFSNDAVLIVALVLIASRAFENTGALAGLTRLIARTTSSTGVHIAITGGLAAVLSAVINNVAALALLMPIDVQAARKMERPPGVTLMPLSFATILGGMVTLIGTPPNIIASAVRVERLGQPYGMFDFSPVGLAVALAGLAFVSLIGWRLVPRREDQAAKLVREASFTSDLLVPTESSIVGRLVAELDEQAEAADVRVAGIVRRGSICGRATAIEPADILVVEGSTDGIAAFIKAADLQEAPQPQDDASASAQDTAKAADELRLEDPHVIEAVVRSDALLIGQSAHRFDLRTRFGVTLLGIARRGTIDRTQVRHRTIEAGDVLLLTGRGTTSQATLDLIGVIPVDLVSVAPVRATTVALAVGLFAGAIALASTGMFSFTVAIAMAVVGYAAFGLVPAKELYQQIDWSVVVMLACLLPIGSALERLGGTALIAESIVSLTQEYSPVVALVALMIVTMTLSDGLNNVATMVISGPIAVDVAQRFHVNPDTFLMGVAIAASCAFLTPIGHKNNLLIMGPGGFRFGDYWRMGLPLELVVMATAVPALLFVWPL